MSQDIEPDAWLFEMEEDYPYDRTVNMVRAEKDSGYNTGVQRQLPLLSTDKITEEIDRLIEELESHEPDSEEPDSWTEKINEQIRAQIEILEQLKEVFDQ